MLARVLGLLPEVVGFHEPKPWLNVEAYLSWSGKRDSDWLRRRLGRRRDGLIEQVRASGLGYVESSHFLSHLIPELQDRYEARFIHLYRDGRDFVRSGLGRNWYRRSRVDEWVKTQIRRTFALDLGFSWADHRLDPPGRLRSRFERIAWLWAEINGVILRGLERVPPGRVESVRVEDFGEDTVRRLSRFLGFELEENLLKRMLGVAARRPNRTRRYRAASPDAWSDRQIEQFYAIAGEMYERLGYADPVHEV